MSTSTNSENRREIEDAKGGFADGLTLVRIILTPVIMYTIIAAWSGRPDDPLGYVSLNMELIVLSSVLFVIAILTDIADNLIGGAADGAQRKYGWLDDIADAFLIIGTLLALMWVTYKAGLLSWTLILPVVVYILRNIVVMLKKGDDVKKGVYLETPLGDLTNALALLGASLLVASPWLATLTDKWLAGNGEKVMEVYNNAATLPWSVGIILLNIAALLSLITGYQYINGKTDTAAPTA